MRRFILAATAISALGALAVSALSPALASADVQRYQTEKATFTVTEPYGQVGQWATAWTHNYTVNFNPCDGTFQGTGVQKAPDGSFYSNEKINGRYDNGKISFTATRTLDGFSWTLTNAPTDATTENPVVTNPTVGWPIQMKVTPPTFTTTSDYKNHGDYVSAMGGGADAAHSCIGMPINSSN